MNTKRIKKWLDALRSGKYKQGTETLRNKNDEFCCLGVACDLFTLNSEGCWKEDLLLGSIDFILDDEFCNSYPSTHVYEWLGIPSDFIDAENDLKVLYKGKLEYISLLNDQGHSFYEIADIIEDTFLNKENRDKLLKIMYPHD